MVLPNFICPGAAKAGTTSLYEILVQHPDVYLSRVNKEAHFFDYEDHYSRGLEWYSRTFFGDYSGQPVIGDITPLYMYLPQAVERIYKDLGPGLRFIFMLRDPVERAYSQYKFNVKRGYERETFENALHLEPERLQKDFFSRVHYSYIDRGLYRKQIRLFTERWPREQMLFITFEDDFLKNKERTLSSVLDFLGLAPAGLVLEKHANATAMPRFRWLNDVIYQPGGIRSVAKRLVPSYELRRKIFRYIRSKNDRPFVFEKTDPVLRQNLVRDHFKQDILGLQEFLGRDLSSWLK